jgi:hypothetical protein
VGAAPPPSRPSKAMLIYAIPATWTLLAALVVVLCRSAAHADRASEHQLAGAAATVEPLLVSLDADAPPVAAPHRVARYPYPQPARGVRGSSFRGRAAQSRGARSAAGS